MTDHEGKVNPAGACLGRGLLPALVSFLVFASSIGFSQAASRENEVVRAVRRASPAVVNISSRQEIQSTTNPFSRFGMDPFFDSFFRDFFDPGLQRRYQRTGLGSGVILSGDEGLILTNAHVISKSASISVVLQDEREFAARVVGADPDSDLAVLRIDAEGPLPFLTMGDSTDLMIGETIIAIGNPFGFSHTVTTGVVSALHRIIRTEERVFYDFIQSVSVEDLTDALRRQYPISVSKGAVITRIDPDSRLAGIGASAGDVIGQIDDLPIESAADFENAVVKYRLKSSVVMLLQRGTHAYYITVRM